MKCCNFSGTYCGRAVDYVNVEQGEKSERKMGRGLHDIPVNGVQGVLNGMEADDFLEKLESGVAFVCVREVCNCRCATITSQVVRNLDTSSITYGQEMMDTTAIPIIIALFTL